MHIHNLSGNYIFWEKERTTIHHFDSFFFFFFSLEIFDVRLIYFPVHLTKRSQLKPPTSLVYNEIFKSYCQLCSPQITLGMNGPLHPCRLILKVCIKQYTVHNKRAESSMKKSWFRTLDEWVFTNIFISLLWEKIPENCSVSIPVPFPAGTCCLWANNAISWTLPIRLSVE